MRLPADSPSAALSAEPATAQLTPATARRACLNCDTPLAGEFCSACGQRDIPAYPSLRELALEALQEFSGWDGKFLATVRALVEKPGKLTREFLEGRRARYLSPVRFYFLASLAFFLLAVTAPAPKVVPATTTVAGTRVEQIGNEAHDAMVSGKGITGAEREKALKDLERAPAVIRPLLRRSLVDPQGFRRSIFDALPKMLFALVPIFALLVSLFYRGLKYPEHLYFSIHLHTYIFLALCLPKIARLTHSTVLASVFAALAVLSMPVYATLAFRRVYGGSLIGTLAKEVGIGTLYVVVSFIALLVTIMILASIG